ncbi:alpha/beta hydrolase [Christensenellaceae bacterium OttesenSCG-928-K19]|nr:alpha/beta hydrolase [Christensenellaceae bacterium OttesenSCG-928-K19]
MKQQQLELCGIPAILWGADTERLFIAVHGDQSHKADDVIRILAEEAVKKGYGVLSFDLPEHGGRKGEARICNVRNCVEDLGKIMKYARGLSKEINLFGCSVGAYFGMMAYKGERLTQALFLSPVVDMKRIIENMMRWFDVSGERLEREGEIQTPVKTLYWDYYQYVAQNPVEWDKPTALLCGEKDDISEFEKVREFAERFKASLIVMEGGEHYFHTEEQLGYFRGWLERHIEP